MNKSIEEMDIAIKCLILEVPAAVFDEVNKRWQSCKSDIYKYYKDWEEPIDPVAQMIPITDNSEPDSACDHPPRNRHYYNDGMYKCYKCGKIEKQTVQ